jgi:hypothetical protein
MSVQKRLREQKKAERAESKRAQRAAQGEKPGGGQIAEREELESYGVTPTFSDR